MYEVKINFPRYTETHMFHIGDQLMINPRGESYAHTRPVGQGHDATFLLLSPVSLDAFSCIKEQLKQTRGFPVTYTVIDNSIKKKAKPNDQKYFEIHEQLDELDKFGLDSIDISRL